MIGQPSVAGSPFDHDPRPHVRRGLSIPSITVLDPEGRVIEDQQRRLFRYNVQAGRGADILFGVGTTGEYNRIQNHERQRLIRILSDETTQINRDLTARRQKPVAGWAGVTAETRALTLANIACALESQADAVVLAPLSIRDIDDVVSFFHREINDLFEKRGASLPIFLYDNRDIAVDPRRDHIRTFDVKRLSRLPYVFGIKVSASRRVLGNYMRGASHYNDQGDFAIYIGNAMLIFDVFHLEHSLAGRVREYWNRFLMHDTVPVGVVSGPGNVFPQEWKRAWYACCTGDVLLTAAYRKVFEAFERVRCFLKNGKAVNKDLACFKYALVLEGVIDADAVAAGTPALSDSERDLFRKDYRMLKDEIAATCPENWVSHPSDAASKLAREPSGGFLSGALGEQR